MDCCTNDFIHLMRHKSYSNHDKLLCDNIHHTNIIRDDIYHTISDDYFIHFYFFNTVVVKQYVSWHITDDWRHVFSDRQKNHNIYN